MKTNTQTILVTGATDGIGKQTAHDLAELGKNVLVHGRTLAKAEKMRDEIRKATRSADVEAVAADLSSFQQIRALAQTLNTQFPQIDVIIHNAAVIAPQKQFSEDGFELTFAVNHLAVFLLNELLLDTLKQRPSAHIVVVSSNVHRTVKTLDLEDLTDPKHYESVTAYCNSKICNVLFTYALARRLQGTNITVNALHPGVIATKLLHAGWGSIGGGDLKRGAETSVYLATSPDVANVTGKYFVNRRETDSSAVSRDEGLQEELWRKSEELVKSNEQRAMSK